MKYKIFLSIITIVLFLLESTSAQNYPPGVTAEIFSTIDSNVREYIDDNLYVTDVLNIDSSLGFELGPRWPDVGSIEDPNELLTNSYVFLASVLNYSIIGDSIGGIIGIFRNNQVLWHSNNLIRKNYEPLKSGYIWSIKDMNRDGTLEIMSIWISRASYDIWPDGGKSPLMYLWIISWNGTEGIILNDVDSSGISKIQISSNGLFRLADVEGDGIWEIQGYAYPLNHDDSLHITEYDSFVLRTFSWNGSLYGYWPNTPQPSEDAYYPKDKLDFNIYASVSSNNDSLEYYYSLSNLSTSFQSIEEMALKSDIETTNLFTDNDCWGIKYRSDSSAIILWTSRYTHCYNFINPGESKNLFELIVSHETVPTISRFYSSGWNTDGYNYNDIFLNSKQNFSISPTYYQLPFSGLNFLDTLVYYNQRSYELGWITSQSTADKYDSLFTRAKTLLEGGHIPWVDSTLHSVLLDVDEDSSGNITSEAYALLRYNTEYLLDNLPEVTAPVISSISPPVALPYYARPIEPNVLTITVTGEFFTDSTVAYYNGNVKPTNFVSDSVVTFSLNSTDFPSVGNYPIWVSNYGSVSDTMVLSVVNSPSSPIIPTLQCIHFNQDKTITAYFGYNNQNSVPVGIVNHSNNNYFSPGDWYQGQPNIFLPGIHTNVFSVVFSGTSLTWHLINNSVTANKYSMPCPGE
ncbi:MAG TPA: hypothetical protein VLB50_02800 [Ignavibacteriaceae bacterium]|nr:hypothetical protein [Ignavibacteriaceae bacterium]